MKTRDMAELAVRNLREALLRKSLTTLGITVGVASLVAMLSLGAGLGGDLGQPLHAALRARRLPGLRPSDVPRDGDGRPSPLVDDAQAPLRVQAAAESTVPCPVRMTISIHQCSFFRASSVS